jgi:hypothetical protein
MQCVSHPSLGYLERHDLPRIGRIRVACGQVETEEGNALSAYGRHHKARDPHEQGADDEQPVDVHDEPGRRDLNRRARSLG